jgi:hypothetical protein
MSQMDFTGSPTYKDVFELAIRLPEKERVRLQKELLKSSEKKAKTKKLTAKDMALGIGRKATDKELENYFKRTSKTNRKSFSAEEVSNSIKQRLAEKK